MRDAKLHLAPPGGIGRSGGISLLQAVVACAAAAKGPEMVPQIGFIFCPASEGTGELIRQLTGAFAPASTCF